MESDHPSPVRREIQAIRKRNQAQRNALSPLQVQSWSRQVIQAWTCEWENLGFTRADVGSLSVALYRAMPGESDLLELETWCFKQGMKVHYPRVVQKAKESPASSQKKNESPPFREIEFVEISCSQSPPSHWVRGAFGIFEPSFELKAVDPQSLACVFTPGLAFGLGGERIGMGGGFYDRFFLKAPSALRIALSFDCHVFPSLPQCPWDQPLHWLWTDQQRFRSPFVDQWLSQRVGGR
ncbi:MAG: 5-formyltetrahydrofolate cyclo-ligase [Bdellovibrionia bacterium]